MHIKLACKAFTDKLNTREISYLFRTIEGSFLIYWMLHLSATFRQQRITFSGSIALVTRKGRHLQLQKNLLIRECAADGAAVTQMKLTEQ